MLLDPPFLRISKEENRIKNEKNSNSVISNNINKKTKEKANDADADYDDDSAPDFITCLVMVAIFAFFCVFVCAIIEGETEKMEPGIIKNVSEVFTRSLSGAVGILMVALIFALIMPSAGISAIRQVKRASGF